MRRPMERLTHPYGKRTRRAGSARLRRFTLPPPLDYGSAVAPETRLRPRETAQEGAKHGQDHQRWPIRRAGWARPRPPSISPPGWQRRDRTALVDRRRPAMQRNQRPRRRAGQERHPLLAGKPLVESSGIVETTQAEAERPARVRTSLADADALSASNRQRASALRQQLSTTNSPTSISCSSIARHHSAN